MRKWVMTDANPCRQPRFGERPAAWPADGVPCRYIRRRMTLWIAHERDTRRRMYRIRRPEPAPPHCTN
jgi:hypothetical protein